MTTHTRRFDPADYLDSPEAQAEYLAAALETDDAAFVSRSLGVIARARGMTRIAKETGLRRESLYKALGENGNPELTTLLRVMKALGVRLSVKPATAARKRAKPALRKAAKSKPAATMRKRA
jgi:probable addiction module antidote protein